MIFSSQISCRLNKYNFCINFKFKINTASDFVILVKCIIELILR